MLQPSVSHFASHEAFFVVFWASVSFQFLVIEILGRHHSSGLDAFLMLWKDVDPDIPILKQAKAETVKLQQPPSLGVTSGTSTGASRPN